MKQELEFFDVSSLPWEAVEGSPGMEQKILSGDKTSADLTRLVRIKGGSDYHEPLVHDFWEEIWALEGEMLDKRTGQTYTAGMYSCRPPGMVHGPFRFITDCLMFEVRYTDPHRRGA